MLQITKNEADKMGGKIRYWICWSIALGSRSMANREAGKPGAVFDDETDDETTHTDHFWKSTHAVIAIGSDIVTHQITGVATGEADTDVVNVGQMNQAVAYEVVPLSDRMDNKINK